jgi:hypothetical protein
MSQPISLKEAERKAYRAVADDGLWDVLLGCFVLLFALAPLLSASLGDFWSSMIFLPFWGLVYGAIWLLRRHVVAPRVGRATLGRARRARLSKLTRVLLAVNVVALAAGVVVAFNAASVPGGLVAALLGMALLIAFSFAAYLLDFPRFYVYGLLLGLSPLVGEWLFVNGYAPHHGYPVVFGFTAAVMILTGLVVFGRLVHNNPAPAEAHLSEEA